MSAVDFETMLAEHPLANVLLFAACLPSQRHQDANAPKPATKAAARTLAVPSRAS